MVVVIIPAHNEANHIAAVVKSTLNYTDKVIVVDDGSTDGTWQEAQAAGAFTLRHKVNLGKGAALKTGCTYATSQGYRKLIMMDADGQHDPAEIPKFNELLEYNDIVFGVRQPHSSMPKVLKFGNDVINLTLQMLHKIKINDSQCGYRAFTADAYQHLIWEAQDYFVETEMIIKAGKSKLRYDSIPIATMYGDKYKGTTVLDGVGIVLKMIGGRLWQ
jgi:glycosyltransferase involved in cell wall biosynthesis